MLDWAAAGKRLARPAAGSVATLYDRSATAKGVRDECATGKITFEEFQKWLIES